MPVTFPFSGAAPLRRWFLVATALGVAAAGTAAAQELRGMRATIGFDQSFEAARNRDLEIPAEGTTLRSVTGLSFALDSETRTQQFSLSTGTNLVLADGPPGTRSREITDPQFTLSYSREGVDSDFDITARYRSAEVEFLRDLDDFVNEDGELEIPEDFADLVGTARRTDYAVSTTLVLGREAAPMGLTLRAGLSGRSYTDTALSLTDTQTVTLGATGRMRLSPVATATLSLDTRRTQDDDVRDTRRDRDSVQLGLSYQIDPRTSLSGSIGYARLETRELGQRVESSEGATARLGLSRELPDGDISAELAAERVETGQRLTGTVGRSWERPIDTFSGSIGVTRAPDGAVNTVGALSWRRPLPQGSISANARSSVGTDSDGEERLNTSVRLNYNHRFSEISAVSLSLSRAEAGATARRDRVARTAVSLTWDHELTALSAMRVQLRHAFAERSGPSNNSQRTDLALGYSQQLTPDWSLNGNLSYSTRREGGLSTSSPAISVGLGRRFDLRL